MLIELTKAGEMPVVRLMEKRLDAQSAAGFKTGMMEIIENNKLIVLDFSMIEFIDSSGLGAIVSLLKAIGKEGDIVLCGLQNQVLTLLKLTRMDKVFSILANAAEAAAFLRKRVV